MFEFLFLLYVYSSYLNMLHYECKFYKQLSTIVGYVGFFSHLGNDGCHLELNLSRRLFVLVWLNFSLDTFLDVFR